MLPTDRELLSLRPSAKLSIMTLSAIKDAIQGLSHEEKTALMDWLADVERELWDAQIARDFSPGGAGMDLLKEVDAEIDRGNFKPL
jgi:hypothetical protein